MEKKTPTQILKREIVNKSRYTNNKENFKRTKK